jgi:hypothetical protein
MGKDKDLRRAVRQAADDGRAACRDLLAVAEELGVPPARVGQVCNEMKIKIHACQLGCFR